jgi:hypothetical protein
VWLIVLLFFLFVVLAVILAVGTISIQGNIYSEVTPGVVWKAPAAAAIMTLFYAAWVFLDYRTLDVNRADFPYDTIFRFSPKDIRDFDQLWVVKNNQETLYRRQSGDTLAGYKFVDPRTGQQWSRGDSTGIVEAIIVDEDGTKVRFEPKLDAQGNFKPEKPGAPIEPFPGYFEVKGKRKMEQLGQVSTFRWGLYLGNWMLNLLHLGLWFVTLWLLLRFQWSHALFMAAVLWVIATLWIVPMLLERTKSAVLQKAGLTTALYGPFSPAVMPQAIRERGGERTLWKA